MAGAPVASTCGSPAPTPSASTHRNGGRSWKANTAPLQQSNICIRRSWSITARARSASPHKAAAGRKCGSMPRTYVLSDIHGHLDKLAGLVARCRGDAGSAAAKFIFLGDYIDRGPDSRGVIEYLIDFQLRQPGDVVCLCGNHEDLALSAIDDPGEIDQWVAINSGDTTLRSYGVIAPAHL